MHTRKKTFHNTSRTAGRGQRRKKQRRKTCIKCALGISVFTLTAASGLHYLKPESDSWIQFLTRIPMNLFADSGRQTILTASTDQMPASSPDADSEHQQPVSGTDHNNETSDDPGSDRLISDGPGSDRQNPDSSGSDRQFPDSSGSDRQFPDSSGSDRQVPDDSGSDRLIPDGSGSDRRIPDGSDRQTSDDSGSDRRVSGGSGSDRQVSGSSGSDGTESSSDNTARHTPDGSKAGTPLPDRSDTDRQTSDTDSARKRHIKDASSDKLHLVPKDSDPEELSEFPSDTDTQWVFFAEADSDSQLLSGPERMQDQLLDTTTDDPGVSHIRYDSDDWNLVLVNPWNELPDDFAIRLARLPNGHSIDIRCYSALMEMMDACRAAGYSPLICSSYRTQEKQESLFQERIDELTAQGYSVKNARVKAATSVARPGTSEHQLGLAVDIVDKSHQMLDATQEYTPVQQWLMQNSWKYGFILRYPQDKSSLTGIIYEPWHYRYVGTEAAKDIYERGICLEEYLEELG